ncbi:uncharacterized protein LOC112345936 [Selaginella moellendorffii]|uniref:uncharacterized protein LOC112345936 n=1 Tax=Selaginella moellendorffii TaxID=88036 RepID=UPI000D1C6D4A|nr:uncharacterized protein LOC112345936 [Selaginella moellendorffii]|eukprot:XP_024529468.1 uncharacterized protein LOC112345936 [Selaginella moellendorffii]
MGATQSPLKAGCRMDGKCMESGHPCFVTERSSCIAVAITGRHNPQSLRLRCQFASHLPRLLCSFRTIVCMERFQHWKRWSPGQPLLQQPFPVHSILFVISISGTSDLPISTVSAPDCSNEHSLHRSFPKRSQHSFPKRSHSYEHSFPEDPPQ